MVTVNQLRQRHKHKHSKLFRKKVRILTPALKWTVRTLYGRGVLSTYRTLFCRLNPHKTGKCKKLLLVSPRKPNSAQRRIAKVELSNGLLAFCYVPGQTQRHGLDINSRVLIRGGRVPDLPGVHYKIIRGKMDCQPDYTKNNGRSKYGVGRNKRPIYSDWSRRY